MIRLYIGNKKVDLSPDFSVHYTYTESDLTNPTTIKNSFSKTITLEGTPTNNQVFNEYYNVEWLQTGYKFNPSKKKDFILYDDDNICESGYVKLDSINSLDGNIKYNITLYGGLGDFFYNLQTNGEGKSLKLKDLEYGTDIDFTINKETLSAAWNSLLGGNNDPKWQTINFAPAYNGLPEDFDSDKMVIKTSSKIPNSVFSDGLYYSKDGYVLATLPNNLTEWEVREFRSYLQRPVIRMKEIIKACCNPINNGGYEVVLDDDFFNANNPYWEKTWLTLPSPRTLEYNGVEQEVDSTLVTDETEGSILGHMEQNIRFEGEAEFSKVIPSSINVVGNINLGKLGGGIYPYSSTSFVWFWNKGGDSYHSNWWCLGSVFVQMIALNEDNVVIGASNTYNLTTPVKHNGKTYWGDNSDYESRKYTPYMDKDIYNVLGSFTSAGDFVKDGETDPALFSFTIKNLPSAVSKLKMVYYLGATEDKIKKIGVYNFTTTTQHSSWVYNEFITQSNMGYDESDLETKDFKIINIGSNIKAVLGTSLGRTGTHITKNLLLDLDSTPCDYLLSYCKMFGLHFTKDKENPIVYIQTRKSFYQRDKIVDITPMLDKTKDITITPLTFDARWYQLKQEPIAGSFYNTYYSNKAIEYGCKMINTGYEFNAENKPLLEGSVIKMGVEGLERSKYYVSYNDDSIAKPWWVGMSYEMWKENGESKTFYITETFGDTIGINEGQGLKYYDLFPKLQIHDNQNKPIDGSNCLVFFNGSKDLSKHSYKLNYYLTDDTDIQRRLNEDTPCWYLDYNEENLVTKIPVFGRYLTGEGSNDIIKSLDFGTAQELFTPVYSIDDSSNIYTNFWKSYIEDLYDVNSRILSCNIRLNESPSADLLRRFYWFDNAIWKLNKITDWNITANDTTQVEFIKVQDVNNYTSITQGKKDFPNIVGNFRVIPFIGTSGKFNIDINNFTMFSPSEGITLTKGENTIYYTITANTKQELKPIFIYVVDEQGVTTEIPLLQEYKDMTKFEVTPKYIIAPYNFTEYELNTYWYNQGTDYISHYQSQGVDNTCTIDRTFKYLTTFNNITNRVLRGKYVITTQAYLFSELMVDVLPELLVFDGAGESKSIEFSSVKDIEITNVPYWLSYTKDEQYITFTSKPNFYEEENDVIYVNGSPLKVKMSAQADIIIPNTKNVNYVFNANGGSQIVNIGTHLWVASIYDTTTDNPIPMDNGWATITTQDSSKNNAILTIAPTTKNRYALIQVRNLLNGELIIINVSQGMGGVSIFLIPPKMNNIAQGTSYIEFDAEVIGRTTNDIVIGTSYNTLKPPTYTWSGEIGEHGGELCTIKASIYPLNVGTYEISLNIDNATAVFSFVIV